MQCRKAGGKKAVQRESAEPDGLVLLCAATAAGSAQSAHDGDAADTMGESAEVEPAAGPSPTMDALTFVTGLRREPSSSRDGLALLAQSSEEIGCRSPRMLHAAITLGDVFGMHGSSTLIAP